MPVAEPMDTEATEEVEETEEEYDWDSVVKPAVESVPTVVDEVEPDRDDQ